MSDRFGKIEGLKVEQVKDLGCIIQVGDTQPFFIEGCRVYGTKLMALPWAIPGRDVPSSVPSPDAPVKPSKPEPSTVATVNVAAFQEETARRNLTTQGEYGPHGPVLARLREVLKVQEPDSVIETAIGNLLALGDHGRYGTAAAIIGLPDEAMKEFSELLKAPDAEKIEAFVDRRIAAGAA
jgi:hypothetical protein